MFRQAVESFARVWAIGAAFAVLALMGAFAQETNAPPPALSILMQALSKTDDAGAQSNLLRGINAALKGRRNVTPPPEWPAVAAKLALSQNAEVREQAQTLGAIFGSSGAFEAMRKTVGDSNADRGAREKALQSLVAAHDEETLPLLEQLVKEPGPLRRAAIRGLSAYEGKGTPGLLLERYRSFDSDEKRDALNTLLARAAWARLLVGALENNQVATGDLGAPQIRQLAGFKDAPIDEWMKKHPALSTSSANKQQEIARYKTFLTPDAVKHGDPSRGRALFAQSCAVCHTLFAAGGNIGPELTGANRTDIDYLLQNILDPNALIGNDYQSTTVETRDGRLLVGMVRGDDANTLTLKTLGDTVIIPRGDIKSIAVSAVSMMPEGLLAALKPDEVADLFAYLASPRQVPIFATALNAADFFNGSDLTRWRASSDAWRVENEEIVGRGGPKGIESLVSEMIAEDYQFTAQIRILGDETAAAEIAFRGQPDETPFKGCSLSMGGGSRINLWQYDGTPESLPGDMVLAAGRWHACEIRVAGDHARLVLDGKTAFELTNKPGSRRNGVAFYVSGKGAELRVKEPKLTVPIR